MDSLREIGYDLPSAMADIVDNSVAAAASRVDITFEFDGSDSWIRIVDNGDGMTGSVLEEAMRYGTERSYSVDELGRFGLGLKTASLSQCRRLTVASRRGRQRRRIEIRQWDLDHVARSNRWEVLRIDPIDAPEVVVEPLRSGPGTVVLWEGLDRVLDYRLPGGAAASHGFAGLADEVARHLAMVFHRFLEGEARRQRRLTMTLNRKRVDPWDPYARAEAHTRELAKQSIRLASLTGSPRMVIRPFVLPAQEKFSTAAAHVRAAGPQKWNRQQGFYFYRNDRLIQAGGWSRLRTADEHTKLARVSVDIPPGSDEMFRINVATMRVLIPPELRDMMTAIASGVAGQAGSSYRAGPLRRSSGGGVKGSDDPPSLVSSLGVRERDTLTLVVDVARHEFREEPDVLRRLLSRIERLPGHRSATDSEATEKVRTLPYVKPRVAPSLQS